MVKCLAKRHRGEYVCTTCNYTWRLDGIHPECRPRYYGEQKLREIRAELDRTIVKDGTNTTTRTIVGD